MLGFFSNAQQISHFRTKILFIENDTIQIDSLKIIPNSVKIFSKNKLILPEKYSVNYQKSILILKEKIEDSILIKYQVFPENLFKEYSQNKFYDSSRISNININKTEKGESEKNDFNNSEIIKSGSISRGIMAGNNQNASVNSDMNLQISGKLSPDISILGAVSDNKIPLQADGSTQNLREFDKIFIKVFSDKTSLTLGDFQIQKPTGYFLNSSKNVQGINFETEIKSKSKLKINSSLLGAVSKGKFNRKEIPGIEGNQGPYRLSGASGESYIFVISSSERIYLDGKILERGSENDYVIDYNSAEITFTSKNIITKDSRIIAEFQYSEMNYTSFITASFNNLSFNKSNFYINYLSEFDSKNQPLQQELTDSQKQILSNSGDDISNAFIENVNVPDENYSGNIFYKRTDSLVNSIIYSNIYVYVSENYSGEKFVLGFSNLGEGNGNYVQKISAVNGRIFEWIAPVQGKMQGNYEPVKLLIAPQKKKMISAGGNFKSKTGEYNFETALSQNDLNLFSNINDGDNNGFSIKTSFLQNIISNDSSKSGLKLKGNLIYIDKNFRAFEEFRIPEFARDWNLSTSNFSENELFVNSGLEYSLGKNLKMSYNFDRFQLKDLYSANKNSFSAEINKKTFKISLSAEKMNSEDTSIYSDFIKYNFLYNQKIKTFTFGLKNSGERNVFSEDIDLKNIIEKSYRFNKIEPFVSYSFKNGNSVLFQYANREDFLSDGNNLTYYSNSSDFKIEMNLIKNPKNSLIFSSTYRKLSYSNGSDLPNDKTFLGRISHTSNIFNGFIVNSFFTDLGSGSESAKEYSYIEVQAGNGIFAWKDFNENGQKEINEFVKAEFSDEAKYIKIALLTDYYIDVLKIDFSETLNLKFNKIFKEENFSSKLLSMFANSMSFSGGRKVEANGFDYIQLLTDSMLISENSVFRNNLSFSTRNRSFFVEYNYRKTGNKILLTNGIDSRNIEQNAFSFTKDFKIIKITLEYKKGNSLFGSQYFEENNYNINFKEINFTTVFKIGEKSTIPIKIRESEKQNILGIENLKLFESEAQIVHSFMKNAGNIEVSFKYIKINFEGNSNSAVSYEMIEGLNSGDNFIWKIDFTKKLLGDIQMSVNYSGRKSNENKIIHTGGISLRAVF